MDSGGTLDHPANVPWRTNRLASPMDRRTIRRSTYAARRVPSSWSCSRSRSSERWRTDARQALAGLGAAIERQFERWQLTDAERSVALLLLKGLSLEEIAAARGTSERTAR